MEDERELDSPFSLDDGCVLVPPGRVRAARKHHIEETVKYRFLEVDFGLGDEFGEGFRLECVVADPSYLSILSAQRRRSNQKRMVEPNSYFKMRLDRSTSCWRCIRSVSYTEKEHCCMISNISVSECDSTELEELRKKKLRSSEGEPKKTSLP